VFTIRTMRGIDHPPVDLMSLPVTKKGRFRNLGMTA
jgi:hypothetical protein